MFLMVKACSYKDLYNYLSHKPEYIMGPPTIKQMMSFLNELTDSDAESLLNAGVLLWNCTAEPESVAVIPAGFIVAEKAVGKQDAFGVSGRLMAVFETLGILQRARETKNY